MKTCKCKPAFQNLHVLIGNQRPELDVSLCKMERKDFFPAIHRHRCLLPALSQYLTPAPSRCLIPFKETAALSARAYVTATGRAPIEGMTNRFVLRIHLIPVMIVKTAWADRITGDPMISQHICACSGWILSRGSFSSSASVPPLAGSLQKASYFIF